MNGPMMIKLMEQRREHMAQHGGSPDVFILEAGSAVPLVTEMVESNATLNLDKALLQSILIRGEEACAKYINSGVRIYGVPITVKLFKDSEGRDDRATQLIRDLYAECRKNHKMDQWQPYTWAETHPDLMTRILEFM